MKYIKHLIIISLLMLVYFGVTAQTVAVQYVRIQQNANYEINLAEVRAIEAGTGTNVALNKTVTSTNNSAQSDNPKYVDGDVNTFGHTGSNAGPSEYLEIDLGGVFILDKIEIINRGDCCQDKAENLQLILKNGTGSVEYSTPIDAYQNQNSGYQTDWNVTFDGLALDFDGIDDRIVTSTNVTIGQQVSAETWFYSTVPAGNSAQVFNSGIGLVIELQTSGKFRGRFYNGSSDVGIVESNSTINGNTWYHAAYVYDYVNNQAELFLNGISQGTATAPSNPSNTGMITIGSHPVGVAPWDGKLDEVRYWNKALTQSEIQNNMNNELTGSETDLEAYFKFNTGIADGSNTGLTWLEDFTSNNNFGKLTNMSLSGTSSNWVKPGGVPSVTAAISGNTSGCDSLALTASGGDTYNWSTGDTTAQTTVLTSGAYTVTVSDTNGNTDVETAVVTIPVVNVSFVENSVCDTTFLTASGGVSYLWDTGDTTPQITLTTAGIYGVTVTDATGCTGIGVDTITIAKSAIYYLDADGDGFGVLDSTITDCNQPAGYATLPGDCDDNNIDVNPNALEVCDSIDNNCNGVIIEGNCAATGNTGEVSPACAAPKLKGEVFFNYGSVTNGLNVSHRTNFTVGQPLVGTIFGPKLNGAFGLWSRFLLVPAAPVVNASNGDLPDRIEVKWEPDPLSSDSKGYKVFRNGSLLATLDEDSDSYLDFNVIAGVFYTYEVLGFNDFGEGYKGSSLGFVNPNGVVTGKVETFTGNPVPGAVVTLTPTLGAALSFDGISSVYMEYDTLFPTEEFTLSCWVKIADGNDKAGIFDYGSNIGKNWWLHTQESGDPKGVILGIGRDTNDVTEISYEFPTDDADEWHNIAATYNGSSLLLYVDGALVETTVADINADSSRLFLGQHPDAMNFFNGKIDDFRIFNRQLPQTEIQMLMNKSASSETPGLVGYWKFDEGLGGTGYDVSSNKIKGHLCGPSWTLDRPDVVNAGITDETGYYKIEGINYRDGTTFTATPSKNFYLNQSLEFNGVNAQYADLTDFDLRDTSALSVTFKAFDFSGNQVILSKADVSGNNHFVLCLNGGNLDLILNGQSHSFGSVDMGFHHVALNLFQDGSSVEAEVYQNGNLLGTHSYSGIASDWGGLPWKLATKADGMGGHNDFFTGLIDEAVFFDTLLTLPDIQEYANVGTDVTNKFLLSMFNLNEGRDTTVADTGPALSGNGTIHGATWSTITDVIEVIEHEFLPGSRLVTLNSSNTATDKVDFTDQSTIPVSGFVRFDGTDCFQKKVEILVNGQSFSPPVFTDEDGKFVLDLEPGLTVELSPKFEEHTYLPAFWELRNISTPVAGILFRNQVKRKVSGQLAGGFCRKSVIPESSIVKVKVETLNGCFSKILELEGDGKFTFSNIPPDSVTVAVIEHSNPVIYNYFQNQGGEVLDLKMEDDTTNFIYFAPPEVELSPLDTNLCGTPMMDALALGQTKIKVFEQYDGGKCYLDTALLTINNNIADLEQFDTLMTEGELTHKFKAGSPNIVSPYLKTLQVTAEAHDEFDTEILNTVVLGKRPRETTFATTSPELPNLILRDPPGDGSSAYVEEGTTTCQTWSYTSEVGGSLGSSIDVSLGPDIITSVGLGAQVTTEIDLTIDLGFSLETSYNNLISNESETCLTTTEVISTGDNDLIVGSAMGGDVYMGGAINYIFGITDELIYDTLNCNYLLDKDLYVFPDGFATNFVYTEKHIESIVIPNLLTIGDTVSADRWQGIIDLNTQLKNEAVFSKNLSFDSGVTYEQSETTETSKTVTHEWQVDFSTEFSSEFGVDINGVGITAGITMGLSTSYNENTTTTEANSRTVGYTLADDDFFDNFSVNIKRDKAYGTPVFEIVSGQSSCPHEPNTQHREEVSMVADALVAVNVPMNDAATFDLTLGNTAPSGDIGFYNIELVPESNPDAAEVSMNGASLNFPQQYQILPNEGQTFTMSIERGPVEFDYENLRVALYSECEFEHAANLGIPREGIDPKFYQELEFDVQFLEPCSMVDIGFPLQGWVLVPADGNILNITVNSYDVNDPDLELIRVQYRRTNGDGAWINIAELPKDSLGTVFTIVPWDTQGLQDALYQIRAVTQCFGAQNPGISYLIDGKIERTPPELFGTPEPADGILSDGDEISITFSEPIRCDLILQADIFNNNNVGLYNTQTGNLVDAIVTCNEDKIVIVPNVPNQFIENVILRVEVDSIQDLAGNFFDHKDWEFFVDRNPLKWKSSALIDTKYEEESKTIVKEIVNIGGQALAYTMIDVPSWVTVYPLSGSLAPGEEQSIVFEFSDDMPVGAYADTIFMDGALGSEPLPLDFRVLCRPPEWEFDPAAYTYSMNFSLMLDIEGEISDDPQDIVAAFVDGDLRGLAHVEYVPALDLHEAFLTVYSDNFSSGTVEFQIWDASACLLYGQVLESFPFIADDLIGTPFNPDTIHTNNLLLREIPLHQGWNWISFNLEFPDASLDSALMSLDHPQNDLVKSQTAFANYQGDPLYSWIGSLDSLNNSSMFQYLADAKDTIQLIGYPINPDSLPIDVSAGWNWISYLPLAATSVDEALANLTPLNGDIIKSQTAFAQFVAGFGWLGNLQFLSAPNGYLLKISNAGTITYPANPFGGEPIVEDRNYVPNIVSQSPWTVNPSQFEHTMTLIGMLSEDEFNATAESHTLGAFVGEEVRGVADAMYIEALGTWYFFMTVYSNESGSPLTFQLFDNETGKAHELNEKMSFLIDAQLGSIEEPEPFTLPLSASTDELMSRASRVLVQPNPFEQVTKILFQPDEQYIGERVTLVITDAFGRTVKEGTLAFTQQWSSYEWNSEGLASGVYFIKIKSGDIIYSKKVVKQ